MRTLVEAALVLAGLGLVAWVSLCEAALLAVTKVQVRQRLEERHPRAAMLQELTDGLQPVLITLVVTLNMAVILASVVVADLTEMRLGAHWLPVTAAATIAFIVLFCEITPKTLGVWHAESVALRTARGVSGLHRLWGPVSRAVGAAAGIVTRGVFMRVFGGRAEPQEPQLTDEEVKSLVSAGEQQGAIEEEEREMIHGVIELADTVAREVMVPRTDMVCLPAQATVAEALEELRVKPLSRVPVFEESVDHIRGVVYAMDLLARVQAGDMGATAAEIARPAYFVPESKRVDDVLAEMQASRTHMAIVIDEHGGTAGLITIDDLLEQIVGEIPDEYGVEGPRVRVVDADTAVVDARASVDEVAEAFGQDLPKGEYDSIGGLVLALMGELPEEGQRVTCEGLLFTVEKMSENRIESLRVEREPGIAGLA